MNFVNQIDIYSSNIKLLMKNNGFKFRHVNDNVYKIEFGLAKNCYFYINSKNKTDVPFEVIYFSNDNELSTFQLSEKVFSNDLCQVWNIANHLNKVIKIKTISNDFNFDEIDYLHKLSKTGIHTTINGVENMFGKIIVLECDNKTISCEYSYVIMNKFTHVDDIDFDYKKLIVDCVQTLKQIHQMSLSHNDIKINNIMYDNIYNKYVIIDYDRMFKPNKIIVSSKYEISLVTYLLCLGYDVNDYMHSYPNDLMALFYTVCGLMVSFDYLIEWIKINKNIITDKKEFYEKLTIERNKIRNTVTNQKLVQFYRIVLRYRYSYSLTYNYIEHYYDDIINLFSGNETI